MDEIPKTPQGKHLYTISSQGFGEVDTCDWVWKMNTLDDRLACLNIEGVGKTWLSNRAKILYVFNRVKKYLKTRNACL